MYCIFCSKVLSRSAFRMLTTCTDFTHVHMIGLGCVPLNTLYKEDSVHQSQPSTHTVCTVRMYCEHACSFSSVCLNTTLSAMRSSQLAIHLLVFTFEVLRPKCVGNHEW